MVCPEFMPSGYLSTNDVVFIVLKNHDVVSLFDKGCCNNHPDEISLPRVALDRGM